MAISTSLQEGDRGRSPRSVVLITGASVGIGRALANEFASRGHDLLLVARRADILKRAATEIAQTHGVSVFFLALDVASPDAARCIGDYASRNGLEVETLVNNAADWLAGPLVKSDPQAGTRLAALNMTAPYLLARYFAPSMIERGHGAILNVGSLAGEVPSPGIALYSASKAFLRSLTLAMRQEFAASGITVSLVLPGPVSTELTTRAKLGNHSWLRSISASSPEGVAVAAVRGLMAGQEIIVPGLRARLTLMGTQFLPRAFTMRLRALSAPGKGPLGGGNRTSLVRPAMTSELANAQRVASHAATPRETSVFRPTGTSQWTALILALAVMTLVSGFETFKKAVMRPPSVDKASAAIAADMLAARERHIDATAEWTAAQPMERSRQIAKGPGYALVLYAMALADDGVASGVDCAANRPNCEPGAAFAPVAGLQLAAGVLSFAALFAIALRLSGSWEVALLTLILSYLVSRVGEFAGLIRTFAWPPVFIYVSTLLATEAHNRGSLAAAFCSGAAIGAGALFAPLIVVMAPAAALCLAMVRPNERIRGVAQGAALLVGAVCSGAILVNLASSLGYDPNALVREVTSLLAERIAYQEMGPQQWIASLLVPVPLLGGVAELIFSDAATRPFAGIHAPGTFALKGLEHVYPQALASATSSVGQLMWLLKHYIIGSPLTYFITIPSILCRGLFAGASIIGLFGLFHLKTLIAYHRIDGRYASLTVVFAPIAALLVANVLLSANHFFQNPGLVFLYAYAIAYVSGRF